jgi:hypothetical protein
MAGSRAQDVLAKELSLQSVREKYTRQSAFPYLCGTWLCQQGTCARFGPVERAPGFAVIGMIASWTAVCTLSLISACNGILTDRPEYRCDLLHPWRMHLRALMTRASEVLGRRDRVRKKRTTREAVHYVCLRYSTSIVLYQLFIQTKIFVGMLTSRLPESTTPRTMCNSSLGQVLSFLGPAFATREQTIGNFFRRRQQACQRCIRHAALGHATRYRTAISDQRVADLVVGHLREPLPSTGRCP